MAGICTETIKSPDDPYVLVEFSTLEDLILPIRSSVRIKFSCVSVSNSFIVCGTNTGGLYLYMRDDLSYRFMIPTEGDGSITQLLISPKDENFIAYCTSKGTVSVVEVILRKSKYEKLRHTRNHEGKRVSALVWNEQGNKLFAGDSVGNVSVVNVSGIKAKDLVQVPSSMILKELDSSVIQLHCNADKLLVSTMTRTYLCNTDKCTYTQIGKQLRDGPFGACFHRVSKGQTPTVYCARPRSRMWEVDYDGNVLNTHQLKKLLAVPSSPVIKMSSEMLPNTKDVMPNTVNFRKLLVFGQQHMVTWSESGLYVINPSLMKPVLWNSQLTDIQDIVCHHNDLYLYHGNNNITKITMLPVEKCIARLFVKKMYLVCAELCERFASHVLLSKCRYHIPASLLVELRDHLINMEMNGHAEHLGTMLRDLEFEVETEPCNSSLSSRRSSMSSVDSFNATKLESGIYVVRTKSMIGYDSDDEKTSTGSRSRTKGMSKVQPGMSRSESVSSQMSGLSLGSDSNVVASQNCANSRPDGYSPTASSNESANQSCNLFHDAANVVNGHDFSHCERDDNTGDNFATEARETPGACELVDCRQPEPGFSEKHSDLQDDNTDSHAHIRGLNASSVSADDSKELNDTNSPSEGMTKDTLSVVADRDCEERNTHEIKFKENVSETETDGNKLISETATCENSEPCQSHVIGDKVCSIASTGHIVCQINDVSSSRNHGPDKELCSTKSPDLPDSLKLPDLQCLSPADSGLEVEDTKLDVEASIDFVNSQDEKTDHLEHGDSGFHDDGHPVAIVKQQDHCVMSQDHPESKMVADLGVVSKTSSRRSSLTSLSSNELMFGTPSIEPEPVIAKPPVTGRKKVVKKKASVVEIISPGDHSGKVVGKKIPKKKRGSSTAADIFSSKSASPVSTSGSLAVKSTPPCSDTSPIVTPAPLPTTSPQDSSLPLDSSPSTTFLTKTSFMNLTDRISNKTKSFLQKVKDSKLLKKDENGTLVDDVLIPQTKALVDERELDRSVEQSQSLKIDLTTLERSTTETREKLQDPLVCYNPAKLTALLSDWLLELHSCMKHLHSLMYPRHDKESSLSSMVTLDSNDNHNNLIDDNHISNSYKSSLPNDVCSKEAQNGSINPDSNAAERDDLSMKTDVGSSKPDGSSIKSDVDSANPDGNSIKADDNTTEADNTSIKADSSSMKADNKEKSDVNHCAAAGDNSTCNGNSNDMTNCVNGSETCIPHYPTEGKLYLDDPLNMEKALHKSVSELTMMCFDMGLVQGTGQLICPDSVEATGEQKNIYSASAPSDSSTGKTSTQDDADWKCFLRCYLHLLDINRLRKTIMFWKNGNLRQFIWNTLVDCVRHVDDAIREKDCERNVEAAFDVIRSGVHNKMATISHVTRLYSISALKTLDFCIELCHLLSPLEVLYLTLEEKDTSSRYFQYYMKTMIENTQPNNRQSQYQMLCDDLEVEQTWLQYLLHDEDMPTGCECGWPLPGSHWRKPKHLDMIDMVLKHTGRKEMVLDVCKQQGFWRGYVQVCPGVISPDVAVKLLLQLGDIEAIGNLSLKGYILTHEEDWAALIKLRELQQKSSGDSIEDYNTPSQSLFCLNCQRLIDLNAGNDECEQSKETETIDLPVRLIPWDSLARLVVANLGPARGCDLLKGVDIPDGELNIVFFQSCLVAALLQQKQKLVTHGILEKVDTYLWSKRQSHLNPQLLRAVDNEMSTVRQRNSDQSATVDEGLFSYLSNQSQRQQRVLEESQTHWGVDLDLCQLCVICNISLSCRLLSATQSGVVIFPCGHGFHKHCADVEDYCPFCLR